MLEGRALIAMRNILICLGLGLLLTVAIAQNTVQNMVQNQASQYTFTVSGKGTVYVEPDVAILNLSIQTLNIDADDATEEASEIITDIQSFLADMNVEKELIRSGQFNVSPFQEYNSRGNPTDQKYQVNHSLTITLRKIELLNEVLGKSLEAGANLSGGIRYSLSNGEEVESQARAKAINALQRRLENYAEQTGLNVGSVLQIWESSNYNNNNGYPYGPGGQYGFNPYGPIPMSPYGPVGPIGPALNAAVALAQLNVPVSPGQIAIEVSVHAIYGIEWVVLKWKN